MNFLDFYELFYFIYGLRILNFKKVLRNFLKSLTKSHYGEENLISFFFFEVVKNLKITKFEFF